MEGWDEKTGSQKTGDGNGILRLKAHTTTQTNPFKLQVRKKKKNNKKSVER